MNRSRRFTLLSLAIALLLVVPIAAVNITVDPYYAFGNNSDGLYLRSERPFKEQRITEFHRDGMVIGNSKMAYIDTGEVHEVCLFNASFSAARPEELLLFLESHAREKEVVIVGLDFWSFSTHIGYSEDNYFRKSRARQLLEYSLTLDGFIDSFRTKRLARSNAPEVYLNSGSRNLVGEYAQFSSMTQEDIRAEQIETALRFGPLKFNDFSVSQERMADMFRLGRILEERQIRHTVLLLPMNYILLESLETAGLLPLYDDWREQMTHAFGRVLDLSDSYNGLENYFFDGTHFVPQVGQKILRAALEVLKSNLPSRTEGCSEFAAGEQRAGLHGHPEMTYEIRRTLAGPSNGPY